MPWTAADAYGHTQHANTLEKQERWAAIANKTLASTGDDALAIRTANAALHQKVLNRYAKKHEKKQPKAPRFI